MSGGVDSAVALLRAGPDAVGVTLRLWLDPDGPRHRARVLLAGGRDRRARDVPRARAPARHARPARGVPPRGRRAVRRGYARGETPNPCMRCNGSFRFDELLAFAGAPARRGSRPATTPASSSATAGCCSRARPTREGPVVHARARSIRGRLGGSGSRSASRRRTRRAPRPSAAGLAAARRAESQEACFLGRRRLPRVPRPPRPRRGARRRSSTRRAASSARTTASGASRPASGAGSASPPASRSTRCGSDAADEHRRRRARARRSPHAASRRAAACTSRVERAEVKLRYRSPAVGADVVAGDGGFGLELDEPAYGVAAGQAAVLYEGRRVVGIRHHRPRILPKP